MAIVTRYDTVVLDAGTLQSPRMTQQGFLRVDMYASRCGILEYPGIGGTRRELRLPEDVFSEDSLAGFEGASITDDHPEVMVDPSNVASLEKGTILGPGRKDGDRVAITAVIKDPALIKKLQTRQKTQTSAGYRVDLEETPGTHPIYGAYHAIQRSVKINHVAVVPQGRSGPAIAVRMDDADPLDGLVEIEPEFSARAARLDGSADQPRDEHGRWAGGAVGAARENAAKASEKADFASDHANRSGLDNAQPHEIAAKANADAAAAHREAINQIGRAASSSPQGIDGDAISAAVLHNSAAEEHDRFAAQHQKDADGAKNSPNELGRAAYRATNKANIEGTASSQKAAADAHLAAADAHRAAGPSKSHMETETAVKSHDNMAMMHMKAGTAAGKLEDARANGPKTFKVAKEMHLENLKSSGWKMSAPGLKVPHATSPDGKTRLWFKAQAVHYTKDSGSGHKMGDARTLDLDTKKAATSDIVARASSRRDSGDDLPLASDTIPAFREDGAAQDLQDASPVLTYDSSSKDTMTNDEMTAKIAEQDLQIAALRKDKDDAVTALEAAKANAAKDIEAEQAATAAARKDAEDKVVEAEKIRTDAVAKYRADVASRVALETSAIKVLGATDKDGKLIDRSDVSDRDLKLQVVSKVDGEDVAAEKSDDYVDALFQGAIKRHARGAQSLATVTATVGQPKSDALTPKTGLDAERAAAEANRNSLSTAWISTATKKAE